MAITEAPHSLAIWMAALPIPLPAACTSTRSPARRPAWVTSRCHEVRKVSGKAAAFSKLMFRGIGITLAAGSTIFSAYVPCVFQPRSWNRVQTLFSPAMQYSQWPQLRPL